MSCKIDNKTNIINNLEKLKSIYNTQEDKKWNIRALSIAINALKKFTDPIISGSQLQSEIKGIGEKIAIRIEEIIQTGTLKEFDHYDDIVNNNVSIMEELLSITGVGPVRAKKWIEIGVKDINHLKDLIKNGKIESTHHIDIGLKYYEDLKLKIPRNEIDSMKILLQNNINIIDKELIFEICGSYRRGLAESGDIDILVSHPKYKTNISKQKFILKIVEKLKSINFIIDSLTAKGATKFMGVCKLNSESSYARRIDIRVVDFNHYYASLIYFTGNKNFNVFLRNKALEMQYSLNEYNLSKLNDKDDLIILNSESHIFEFLGIPEVLPLDRNY